MFCNLLFILPLSAASHVFVEDTPLLQKINVDADGPPDGTIAMHASFHEDLRTAKNNVALGNAKRSQLDMPDQLFEYPVRDSMSPSCSEWNPESHKHPPVLRCGQHHVFQGAPWGLVFFGMSLSKHTAAHTANDASVTHQTKLKLDRLQDRGYEYVCHTNDDGWLAGGGNSPSSFMITAIDSSHMEFVHPGSICANLASGSEVQPDTGYQPVPSWITGAPLAELVDLVRSKLAFDPIRVVPTGGKWTETNEYQLRFDPTVDGEDANPTMLAVHNRLLTLFANIETLEAGDPFHVSMCRDVHFCSNDTRNEFFNLVEKNTVQPWKRWAKKQGGIILNDEVPGYQDKAGGFYLFVSRNRPLIYFAPLGAGAAASGSVAYYCEWMQDGKVVDFANPYGGPVTETLIKISENVADDIKKYPVLKRFSDELCADYSFDKLPRTEWTAGQ